jgi:hypothetical protein
LHPRCFSVTGVIVFIGQVLLIWLLAVWGLRKVGLDPEIANPAYWLRRGGDRRRVAERARLVRVERIWLNNVSWWLQERDRHEPGTRLYEAANDMLTYLYANKPLSPNGCGSTGFYCTTPNCIEHPRSHR